MITKIFDYMNIKNIKQENLLNELQKCNKFLKSNLGEDLKKIIVSRKYLIEKRLS